MFAEIHPHLSDFWAQLQALGKWWTISRTFSSARRHVAAASNLHLQSIEQPVVLDQSQPMSSCRVEYRAALVLSSSPLWFSEDRKPAVTFTRLSHLSSPLLSLTWQKSTLTYFLSAYFPFPGASLRLWLSHSSHDGHLSPFYTLLHSACEVRTLNSKSLNYIFTC